MTRFAMILTVASIALVLGAASANAGLGLVARFSSDPVAVSPDQISVSDYASATSGSEVWESEWVAPFNLNMSSISWSIVDATDAVFDLEVEGVEVDSVDTSSATEGTATINEDMDTDETLDIRWDSATDPGDTAIYVYGEAR